MEDGGMSRKTHRIPQIYRHTARGKVFARLRLGGRNYCLGPWGDPVVDERYRRLIAEWSAAGKYTLPTVDVTIAKLVAGYLAHCDQYYGAKATETRDSKLSLQPLLDVYANLMANEFGPKALKAVRQTMIDRGWARQLVNQRIRRVKRLIAWAVSQELVRGDLHHALTAVEGLRKNRGGLPEYKKVRPVPTEHVDATLPHVTAPVRALIQLQRYTGMRPGEAVIMRACDLDMTGEVWRYRPHTFKAPNAGDERVILLGPRAQAIVRPFLSMSTHAYLFSPRLVPRKSKRSGKHLTREHYSVASYWKAISKGCVKAKVPAWHPHQLRHALGTSVRQRFGLEAAQVVLGHAHAAITEVYAERDLLLAERVAREVG
jgi:integrase